MPFTINGIGTHYWGKRHVYRESATCQYCNAYGEKISYDTTLFFTIFFLPVIPIGQKRIFQQCPKCTRHRVMPLKEWEGLKKRNVSELSAQIQSNPDDVGLQQKLIYTLIGHQDVEGVKKVIERLLQRPIQSAALWCSIADGREYCGDLPAAEEALVQARALEDTLLMREALARIMILRHHPDEARPLLEHLLKQPDAKKIGLLTILTEAYQVTGQHEKALALLDEMAPLYPETGWGKEFIVLRKVSVKNRAKGRPTKPKYLLTTCIGRGSDNHVTNFFARYAVAAVAAILLGAYLVTAVSRGLSRDVYLVNGLDRPYEVEFNGERVKIAPGQYTMLTASEGRMSAKIVTPGVTVVPTEFVFKTPFFSRPFVNHLLVINPDRAAILLREENTYAARPELRAFSYGLLLGKDFYDLTGVDYPFQDYPEKVSLGSSEAASKKIRVSLPTHYSQSVILNAIVEKNGKPDAELYIKNHLIADPSKSDYLYYLPLVSDSEKIVEFLRLHLGDRPVLVNWHRYYQALQEGRLGQAALTEEYEKLLAADPSNNDLIYLLARVVRPREKELELYQRATQGEHPSAYAFNALAYESLAQADFATALDYSKQALKLAPGDIFFEGLEQEALMGLGRWDELLEGNRRQRIARPKEIGCDLDEYRYLLFKKDDAAAQAFKRRCVASWGNKLTPDQVQMWEKSFALNEAYERGDVTLCGKLSGELKAPRSAFISAVCLEEDEKAAKLLADEKQSSAASYLTVYLLAHRLGHESLAQEQLKLAVESFRKNAMDVDSALAADLLEGKGDFNAASKIVLMPDVKAILLTTLGTRDAANAKAYFEQARRYIVLHAFPEHLLLSVAQ